MFRAIGIELVKFGLRNNVVEANKSGEVAFRGLWELYAAIDELPPFFNKETLKLACSHR